MNLKIRRHIYLDEILDYIPQSDTRAAESWCKRKGVQIHTDGRNKYVFQHDFEVAYNKPNPINSDYYVKPSAPKRYKPKSDAARGILNNLS